MSFLPTVKIVSPGFIAQHMGHRYYKSFYDANDNVIYVNRSYGLLFSNLLHEMGHWLLCLLPHVDAVYRLNIWYDKLDRLHQNVYITRN